MEDLEEKLRELVEGPNDKLGNISFESLKGGKRLRPLIILMIGEMYNANRESLYTLAASIEMLHGATIAHDDFIDDSSRRRLNFSNKMVIQRDTKILIGDYLFSKATQSLAKLDNTEIMKIYSQVIIDICEGEYSQLSKSRYMVSRKSYYNIIQKKTASLFSCAAEMAGILSGVDEETLNHLKTYALELGTLYQIVDDVLDITGDEEKLGKTLRQDLKKGIMTLPLIYYIGQPPNKKLLSKVFAENLDEDHLCTIIEDIKMSGAIESALGEAEDHARCCRQALEWLPEGSHRQVLASIVDYVLGQTVGTR